MAKENKPSSDGTNTALQEMTIDLDAVRKALEAGILPVGYEIVFSCPACLKQFRNKDDCHRHTENCNVASLQEIQQMYVDKILEKEFLGDIRTGSEVINSEENEQFVEVDIPTVEESIPVEECVPNKEIKKNPPQKANVKSSKFDPSDHFKCPKKLGSPVQDSNKAEKINKPKTQIIIEVSEDCFAVESAKVPLAINLEAEPSCDLKEPNSTKNSDIITDGGSVKSSPKNTKSKNATLVEIAAKRKRSFLDRISEIAPVKAKEEFGEEDRKVYEFRDADMEARQKQAKLAILNKKRTCPFCDKLFDDPMDVLRHKRVAHNFQRKYLPAAELEKFYDTKDKSKCPICDRPIRGGYGSTFLKHLITHREEYSFQCKTCNMMFRRRDHKEQHEARHIV